MMNKLSFNNDNAVGGPPPARREGESEGAKRVRTNRGAYIITALIYIYIYIYTHIMTILLILSMYSYYSYYLLLQILTVEPCKSETYLVADKWDQH